MWCCQLFFCFCFCLFFFCCLLPLRRINMNILVWNWILLKKQKTAFESPFRGPRSNVCTPSIARWKARGDFLFVIIELFFAISYGWDVISGNLAKSAFFEGSGSPWAQILDGVVSPTNHCWCQKTRVIALSCGIKMFAVHCLVLSQSTHVTDGRTSRITTAIIPL